VSSDTRARHDIISLFFMAHLSAVPIRSNDGRKVNGLRVQELKAALVSDGVPESEHVQSKADK
jgi:hypothetical protein